MSWVCACLSGGNHKWWYLGQMLPTALTLRVHWSTTTLKPQMKCSCGCPQPHRTHPNMVSDTLNPPHANRPPLITLFLPFLQRGTTHYPAGRPMTSGCASAMGGGGVSSARLFGWTVWVTWPPYECHDPGFPAECCYTAAKMIHVIHFIQQWF